MNASPDVSEGGPASEAPVAEGPVAEGPVAEGPAPCAEVLASGTACRNRARHVADGRAVCGVHVRGPRGDCPVCLDGMGPRGTVRMGCGHAFHTRCLRSWFRDRALTCPTCRAVCLEGLPLLGPRTEARLRGLVRTVPPRRHAFFPAYMSAQLADPRVAAAVGAAHGALSDLTLQCFTRDIFFALVREIPHA